MLGLWFLSGIIQSRSDGLIFSYSNDFYPVGKDFDKECMYFYPTCNNLFPGVSDLCMGKTRRITCIKDNQFAICDSGNLVKKSFSNMNCRLYIDLSFWRLPV